MMNAPTIVLTLALVLCTATTGQTEEVYLSGRMDMEFASDFDGGPVIGRLGLLLEADTSPTDWLTLVGIGRIQLDLADELEPGKPSQLNRSPASRRALFGDYAEMELREFYADIAIDDIFLRVGKQQIVWGQADGLKVLDVVNPQSFREFILDDFDSSRIPLWALSAQVPFGDVIAEFVFVPDNTFDDIPANDAYFAVRSPLLILPPTPGKELHIEDPDRPGGFFADADYGVALTALVGNWDLSFNYLYQYNNLPQFLYFEDETSLTITPNYTRTHMIGGSFSTSLGDFILRGEMAWFTNRAFTVSRQVEPTGSTLSGEFSYVIGLDYSGISDTFISVQLFQSFVENHVEGMIRGNTETNMTFFVRYKFNGDLTKLELRDVTNLERGDGYVELSAEHELRDNLTLGARVVVFYGDQFGLIGQYHDKDFFGINLEVGF
jgi:hypothetical protein